MSHCSMIPMYVIPWHGTNACHSMVWASSCHTMAWHQYMSHYSMVPTCHGTNACYTIALYQCTSHYDMLHHGMVPIYNAYHTIWHDINACYTMAWYQYIMHIILYGIISMHVTLWHDPTHVTLYHGTDACHIIA